MAEKYSKGDYATLPTTDVDLENTFSAGEVTAVSANDGSYASQNHNDQYGIFQFRNTAANSTGTFSLSWNGKVEVNGSIQSIYLAVYNQNASSWETLASNNTIAPNTDFAFTAEITASASNYYNSDNEVVCRVYQSAPLSATMQFYENDPGRGITNSPIILSNGTIAIQGINIPLTLPFVIPCILITHASYTTTSITRNYTFQLGLYSLTGSTLTLVNSASANYLANNTAVGSSWVSMVTSATSNIIPGTWYIGINFLTGGMSESFGFIGGNQLGAASNPNKFHRGRLTVSSNAMPASIATSNIDITGTDAFFQPYIIITS